MTNEQKAKAIETLRANLDNLDDWGRNFAGSLLDYWDERGDLSDKQWSWVPFLSGTGPKPGGGQRRQWNGRRRTSQGPKAKGPSQAETKLREAEKKIADLTRQLEQAKMESQQSDPRWEAMVSAFQRATASQRKLVMRSMHPDKWGGAEWATKVFQAANK
jgi:hypothetical protein